MGCRGKPHVRRVVRKRQGCKQEVAYLGGIGPCSFGEIFCHHRTNLENLGSPPLCVSTSDQQKFDPILKSYKYATASKPLSLVRTSE